MQLEGWTWWIVVTVTGLLLGLLLGVVAERCGVDPTTLPSPVNYP
jgi:hypothetical protein